MNNMRSTRISGKGSKKPRKTAKTSATPRSTSEELRLKAFASSVGDFIRYWGFRRIHGQIWVIVYLSNKPLSGVALTRALGVSKALVSPALSELLTHKLVLSAGGDLKTKLYVANPDVISVIAEVLQTRESILLDNAQSKFSDLSAIKPTQLSKIELSRLAEIGSMISMARFGLSLILQNIKGGDLNLLKSMVSSGRS